MGKARIAALAIGTACGAMPALAEWKLVRHDDFSRPLDTQAWSIETGFQRNRESQYYTPANLQTAGGALVIEARRERLPNAAHRAGGRDWRASAREAGYTSGSIVLRDPVHFGRIEVEARAPVGRGTWPAIWLLDDSAGQYGEIDIFEAVGKHPDTTFGAVHFGGAAATRRHVGKSLFLPGFDGAWHTHVLEWSRDLIRITMDGREVLAFNPADAASSGRDPLRRPMRLHINLALGGSWGGAIDDDALPARFEVRSLRIFRWDGAAGDPAPAVAGTVPTPVPAPASTASAPRYEGTRLWAR
jgi:beta-glucanase (GH16 family)